MAALLCSCGRFLAPALVLLVLPHCIWGRMDAGTLRLGAPGEQWQYVGKFGYGVGTGRWTARIRSKVPRSEVKLRFEVFLDEEWPHMANMEPCSEQADDLVRAFHDASAEGDSWGDWVNGTCDQNTRAHIWYFAVSACPSAVGQNTTTAEDYEFELHYVQADGSELSFELKLMPSATLLVIMCLSVFLLHFVSRIRGLQQSFGEVHGVILCLASAVLLQLVSEVLHLCHLHLYEYKGFGDSALEGLSGMLFMLSQTASCTLLVAIAKGYTLANSKACNLQTLKSIAMCVAILHAMLVGHGACKGEHSEKHHENAGAVGWALVAARLMLYAWFEISARELQKQSQSVMLQSFLAKFRLAGSAYFLSYGIIFAIVQIFAPYLQHPLLYIGTAAMQTCAAVWLSELFLSRGAYYEVSTLGSSFLPGGLSFSGGRIGSPKRTGAKSD